MREYGQIQCSFWQSADAQAFSDAGKALAAYLMTGPHTNGIGCYRLPDGYVMADFGWSADKVSKTFDEQSRNGFADRFGDLVFLPKFLRWNGIANPGVAKARQKEFEALPKGEAKNRVARAMLEFGDHWSDGFKTVLETFSQTVSAPCSRQDPIQPEPNLPDPSRAEEEMSATPTDRSAEIRRVFKHWQETWTHPGSKLDDTRRKIIAKALELYSEADLCQCITGYTHSPYHTGENDRKTVYDSIELFLKDARHIDTGLKFYREPPRRELSALTTRNAAATADWVPPEIRYAAR
jgi:hypothetical protein